MSDTLRLWPPCVSEFETILKCTQGYSLARFGDGELKLMFSQGYAREPSGNERLAAELRAVLLTPHERCIVGIPTMDPKGPKYQFIEPSNGATSGWVRHRPRFMSLLKDSEVPLYYSAFVTRPDSSPWIKTADYATQVQALWAGKRAVVMCEKGNSLYTVVQKTAYVRHVRCPSHGAYAQIDTLEQECIKHKPQIVIASAGPTATCLANRLSKAGMHALDLGSIGGWLKQILEAK